MRVVLVFWLIFLLAACAKKPISAMSYPELRQFGLEISKICMGYGIKSPSEEFDRCFSQEVSKREYDRIKDEEDRIAIGRALAAGMSDMGNAYRNAARTSPYQPPINCTTKPGLNGSTQTVCQ